MKVRIIIKLKQKSDTDFFCCCSLYTAVDKWKRVLSTSIYQLLFFCIVLNDNYVQFSTSFEATSVPLLSFFWKRFNVSIWSVYPEYFHCFRRCVQQANWCGMLFVFFFYFDCFVELCRECLEGLVGGFLFVFWLVCSTLWLLDDIIWMYCFPILLGVARCDGCFYFFFSVSSYSVIL